MSTRLKWLMVVPGLLLGFWMSFDGIHAMVTGDFVTPSSGKYAGQLGPWSYVISFFGLDPRSIAIMILHLVLGLAWIVFCSTFVTSAGFARKGLLTCAVCTLWYLPFGTLVSVLFLFVLAHKRYRLE